MLPFGCCIMLMQPIFLVFYAFFTIVDFVRDLELTLYGFVCITIATILTIWILSPQEDDDKIDMNKIYEKQKLKYKKLKIKT